jgi:hypothetical protein
MPERTRRSHRQSFRIAAMAAMAAAGLLGASGCAARVQADADRRPVASTDVVADAARGVTSPRPSTANEHDDRPSPLRPDLPVLRHTEIISTDATLSTCDTEPGAVGAGGTVVNTASGPADIVVMVSWTTDGSVTARGAATLHRVPPGTTVPWRVAATLAAGTTLVRCELHAQRGHLA